ncbi:hypothetical protein KGP40_02785 [Weissella cibaria]|uniref:hypothetical protein n=1 Tax=Weissella cibaria TaxID=137591 RepID=UPI001C1F2975|nr:hypothetical protein [Weissella cibaria]MBU7560846.1 hypothetical protein [Weissella cibaria]
MKSKMKKYLWIGVPIIIILLGAYITFIIVCVLRGKTKVVSELSPLATLVTLGVNTVFTLLVSAFNISQIDQKTEKAAARKTIELRNNMWMERYRDERLVLKELLHAASNLWVATNDIISAIDQDDIKYREQSNKVFGESINDLLHKSVDMITPSGATNEELKNFFLNFEPIRPTTMLEYKNEQSNYLDEKIKKSEYFFNQKHGGFVDSDRMIHVLIQALVPTAENIRKTQQIAYAATSKLSRGNKDTLMSSLEKEAMYLFGILFILENEINQRIVDVRKYEVLRVDHTEE